MPQFEAINYEDLNSPEVIAEKEECRKTLITLFDTKKFSDVTFVVNKVEFPAHKNILSTRSAYFDKMFSDWKESKENKVTICDIAPEVFKIILEFVYKGQLSDWKIKLEAYAVDLIAAANMYAIDALKRKCEKFIIRDRKINVQTACEYFIIADDHNALQLKEATFKFIQENLEEIKTTDGYKAFKRHQTNAASIVEIASRSKKPRLYD